jgi:hypothetical protein
MFIENRQWKLFDRISDAFHGLRVSTFTEVGTHSTNMDCSIEFGLVFPNSLYFVLRNLCLYLVLGLAPSQHWHNAKDQLLSKTLHLPDPALFFCIFLSCLTIASSINVKMHGSVSKSYSNCSTTLRSVDSVAMKCVNSVASIAAPRPISR